MGLVKNTLFKFISFTLLIMTLCYGISILLPGENITYLQRQTINGQTLYNFDWNSWIQNITTDGLTSSIQHFINIFTIDIETIVKCGKGIGQTGGEIFTTLQCIGCIIFDGFALLINTAINLFNITISILTTLLNLIGINTKSNTAILNAIRTLKNIPSIHVYSPAWIK